MAVNSAGIISLYGSMVDAVTTRYTAMWNSNQIDAETYAKLVGEASSQFMQFAAELVQKQEQLDVQNQLVAKQVLNEAKQLELITKQVEIAGQELLLKQKQIDVTEREMVEKELTGTAQRTILDTEKQAKQYEVDYLQPAQLAQLQKQTEVVEREMSEKELTGVVQRQATQDELVLKERQIVDQELTSAKQRTILDTQEQAEQYKVDNILPKELAQITAQLAQLQKQTDVTEREMVEKELTGAVQRQATQNEIVLKERQVVDQELTSAKQRAILDTEEQAKQYEVDYLQPAQLTQLQKQTDVLERETKDKELTSAKQRTLLDTQEQAEQYKVDNILPKELEKMSKDIAAVTSSISIQEAKLDDELSTSAKQRLLLDTDNQLKQYELVTMQPAQLAQLQKQVEVLGREITDKELTSAVQRQATIDEVVLKTRQVVDQELTSAKQRTLLDTQEQAEQYKVDSILPKELAQITAQVAVLELQDDELNKKILILEEQRKATKAEVVIKDKEAAKLGLDNVVKNAEAARLTNPTAVYVPKYGV